MADRIPDFLIDDILESAKLYSNEDKTPIASMSEIDDLIASLGISDAPEKDIKQPEKEKVDALTASAEEKPRKAKAVSESKETAKPVPEKMTVSEKPEISEEKTAVNKKPVISEAEKAALKERISEKKDKKTPGFLDFIKKSNVFGEEPSGEYFDYEYSSPSSEEDTENVVVSETEDGQMELQVDGEEISAVSETVRQEEKKTEADSVSGQISIEKTRMFNEVKIHGEYNPNISHNLGNKVARTTTGEGEALSTPVMGEEKYRKHFMNKPVQNLEKTQEHRVNLSSQPEKTLETPGIIVKKNSDATADTDGFEPIPTILPAEYGLKDEIRSHSDEVSDGQIMLEGFEAEENVEKTTEEEAEARLLEARKEAVKQFVDKGLIFKQAQISDESEEFDGVQTDRRKKRYARNKVRVKREFFGPKDTEAVIYEFLHEKRNITVRLAVLSVICFVMAVISAIAGSGSGNFDLFGGEEAAYITVQLTLLIICCLISFNSIKQAFKSTKLTLDHVIAVSAFAGILQTAVSYAFTDSVESAVHLFTAAAVVPMIFKAAGELIDCRNNLENFLVVSNGENGYYTVENIEDEDSAAEIARGLMLGEPEIKYSAKVGFPSRFVEKSREADVTPSILKYSFLGTAAVSLIIGIITLIIEKNVFLGITAFAGAFLMGVPAAASIISASSISHANKKLREDGTVINGYSAVENAVNSNGVVIDSADAFKSGGCNIEGIKLYHKMRIDEALLYTASVVIASGGVLSEIFEGVIIGKNELLLPVETLAYEEKLGCSCWIHNHRVLVGNRELLKHHNVEIPDDGLEEKYRAAGKNTLYLAIEGKIAAMFIVVYKADEMTAHYIRALERDGVSILFRTSDANITESFLEHEFRLPKNVVKIINPVAGEMFSKIKNEEKEQSDAHIVHDGRVVTMLKALHLSFAVSQFINASRTVQAVAAVIGVLLVACLSFMSGLGQVSALQIILYQIVWCIVLYFIPAIKKPNKRVRK